MKFIKDVKDVMVLVHLHSFHVQKFAVQDVHVKKVLLEKVENAFRKTNVLLVSFRSNS